MKHNQKHNQKGFTLIELIVVVAIMGVIGAILIPQFSTMNLRSRMSTDVSSIKTAQNQVEIYYNDLGVWPGTTADDVISNLVAKDYLDSRYLSGTTLRLQTKDGAAVAFDATNHRLQLSLTGDNYAIYNNQDDKDAGWVIE